MLDVISADALVAQLSVAVLLSWAQRFIVSALNGTVTYKTMALVVYKHLEKKVPFTKKLIRENWKLGLKLYLFSAF